MGKVREIVDHSVFQEKRVAYSSRFVWRKCSKIIIYNDGRKIKTQKGIASHWHPSA